LKEHTVEFYYYVNIFETKGLEYLLLLSFLVLFILLVRYLAAPGKKEPGPGERDPTAGRQWRAGG
jgi:hypothetical protein